MSLPVVNKPNCFVLHLQVCLFFFFFFFFSQFCLHIFFVHKHITNLARISFCILEATFVNKKKNGFGNTANTTTTTEVDGIIYRETIYQTANVLENKIMYTGRHRIGQMFYHRTSLYHGREINIS